MHLSLSWLHQYGVAYQRHLQQFEFFCGLTIVPAAFVQHQADHKHGSAVFDLHQSLWNRSRSLQEQHFQDVKWPPGPVILNFVALYMVKNIILTPFFNINFLI